MSVHSVRLLVAAQQDFRDILVYTANRWGRVQRSRYRDQLLQAFDRLSTFPESGPARDDLFPGCRNLRVGQHIIFYQIAESEIIVSRILHQHQDAASNMLP